MTPAPLAETACPWPWSLWTWNTPSKWSPLSLKCLWSSLGVQTDFGNGQILWGGQPSAVKITLGFHGQILFFSNCFCFIKEPHLEEFFPPSTKWKTYWWLCPRARTHSHIPRSLCPLPRWGWTWAGKVFSSTQLLSEGVVIRRRDSWSWLFCCGFVTL